MKACGKIWWAKCFHSYSPKRILGYLQKDNFSRQHFKKASQTLILQSVTYLGVKIDKNLNWHHYINDLAFKLNIANAVLFKIRNYVNQKILRCIYFAIFDSHLNYADLSWAQILMQFNKLLSYNKSHQNNIISAWKLPFKSFF